MPEGSTPKSSSLLSQNTEYKFSNLPILRRCVFGFQVKWVIDCTQKSGKWTLVEKWSQFVMDVVASGKITTNNPNAAPKNHHRWVRLPLRRNNTSPRMAMVSITATRRMW